ncbi:MAG TPA: DUF1264 domain-containing protein [Gemmatimonadales bacterium]|nr:DUF1264 domain-containing protein [Gemmatimonadales bacterium]
MSASKIRKAGLGAAALAILAVAPAAAQDKGPVPGFTTHIVATHYLRGETYETHHYFKQLREGVLQGLVFRQGAGGAPLIEVEWAIGKAVYDSLPDWQKMNWHPLAPAVAAGRVTLPDLSDAEEAKMLATVRTLYAQTINLAGIEGELPTGLEGVGMATHMRWGEK